MAPAIGSTIPPNISKEAMKNKIGGAMAFDMEEYCKQAVALYKEITGIDKLRIATTPFVADGALVAADDGIEGQLSGSACKILMKNLWLARLARSCR